MPEPERVFGSLPAGDLHAITIPGLADDLAKTEAAWHAGTLRRMHSRRHQLWMKALDAVGVLCAIGVVWWLMRRRRSA